LVDLNLISIRFLVHPDAICFAVEHFASLSAGFSFCSWFTVAFLLNKEQEDEECDATKMP
jgi:hypothetical protein